ncbi:MAG: hypothetical protein RL108_476 [Bacteroidota bacterium]|jgi:hypothetical protein
MQFELPKIISDPKNHSGIGIVKILIDQILMYKNSGISLKKIYIHLYDLGYITVGEKSFYSAVQKSSLNNSVKKIIIKENENEKNFVRTDNIKEERKKTLRDILEEDIIIQRAPRD